eukprot:6188299-Pleurochrysis_carterae.AAC.5
MRRSRQHLCVIFILYADAHVLAAEQQLPIGLEHGSATTSMSGAHGLPQWYLVICSFKRVDSVAAEEGKGSTASNLNMLKGWCQMPLARAAPAKGHINILPTCRP